jgi:hypothetical protein
MDIVLQTLMNNRRSRIAWGHWRGLVAWITIGLQPLVAGAQSGHNVQRAPQAVSCSLPGLAGGSSRVLTAGDLLAAYNVQAELIHSIRGSLIARLQDDPELGGQMINSRPFPAMLSYRSPASLRMTGVIPFTGRRSFDLASDGRSFRLLVPEEKVMRMIVGPVDALATSTNPRENIRPQMILGAIRWFSAKLATQAGAVHATGEGIERIDVVLTTSTGGVVPAQLDFDLQNATLARLTIPDPEGKSAVVVDYADWQSIAGSGNGSHAVCFPRRMYAAQQEQKRRVELKFTSVEVNVAIAPAQFQLIPPPGVIITRVGGKQR